MRDHKSLIDQIFKILMITGLIGIPNSVIYSQEEMQDAIVSVSFSEDNDAKTIKAIATDQAGLPIEELDLYFYVKRTFSLLPIGDVFNTTDENGEVIVEFPDDLPGDTEGNVIIIVKILESDLYNDLSIETVKNWGIQTFIDESHEKRSLWAAAANAPLTLVFLVSGMILVIWFIIWYIIFVLYKISKIKPIQS